MSKRVTASFLSCGASAVIVDEYGQVTTSVDRLANGIKRLFAKRSDRSAAAWRK